MTNQAMKKWLIGTAVLCGMLVAIVGCRFIQQKPEPKSNVAPSTPVVPLETKQEEKETYSRLSLLAVGDVLIHSSLYKEAKTKDGYDFTDMFAEVKPFIEQADIAIANQESMIGGTDIGLSDYPRFNSPTQVGDALKDAGFDLVTLANNHTLDRGEAAILQAIAHWNKLGLEYVGAYESPEDQQRIRVLDKNGITMAFLAYTYGTNGIRIPEGKAHLVNLIDPARITTDIQAAKKLADTVIVSLHFGQEYVNLPNEEQKTLAHAAANAGADIIIGHHPHVLQPMEWIDTSDGRKAFVVYSLGNFIAGQDGARKRTGGMVELTIEKKQKGKHIDIQISSPSFIPTWIAMSNWRGYKIVPLRDAPEKQLPNKQTYIETIHQHMSRWMPELEFPLQ